MTKYINTRNKWENDEGLLYDKHTLTTIINQKNEWVYVRKALHLHLPTPDNTWKSTDTKNCHRCPEIAEDNEHMWRCGTQNPIEWTQTINNLKQIGTTPPVMKAIKELITSGTPKISLYGKDIKIPIKEQKSIGWTGLFRGLVSKSWKLSNKKLQQIFSITTKHTPEKCLTSLALIMQKFGKQIWLKRNEERLESVDIPFHTETLMRQIIQTYADRGAYPNNSIFFNTSIENILQLSFNQKMAWLNDTKLEKKLYKLNLRKILKGQKLISQYFQK